MSLVTHFERSQDGPYISIEQNINSDCIPEGSTFVAFDSVEFARSTGQVAITNIACSIIEGDSRLLMLDNRDHRWLTQANIKDEKITTIQYLNLGPAMIEALRSKDIEKPVLTADCLRVWQRIDKISDIEYIVDGPIDLISSESYDDGTLPVPGTDVDITPSGGLRVASRAILDPNDYV